MKFTQQNKNHLIAQMESALKSVREMPVSISCHSCVNYDLRSGVQLPVCRKAGVTPPPEVVEVGCESYLEDHTIPPF